jgi:predicted RNase H-like nuclease (RuvC/YqgF family)
MELQPFIQGATVSAADILKTCEELRPAFGIGPEESILAEERDGNLVLSIYDRDGNERIINDVKAAAALLGHRKEEPPAELPAPPSPPEPSPSPISDERLSKLEEKIEHFSALREETTEALQAHTDFISKLDERQSKLKRTLRETKQRLADLSDQIPTEEVRALHERIQHLRAALLASEERAAHIIQAGRALSERVAELERLAAAAGVRP